MLEERKVEWEELWQTAGAKTVTQNRKTEPRIS